MMRRIVTPAGRRQYLEILLSLLKRQKSAFDVWDIWLNTSVQEDVDFILKMGEEHYWINIIKLDKTVSRNYMATISDFWKTIRSDSVYLRLDDDIVGMSDTAINDIFEERLRNPSPFLVYGNIVNNQKIDFLRRDSMNLDFKITNEICGNLWKSPIMLKKLHEWALSSPPSFALSKTNDLHLYPRVSINACAFFGHDVVAHDFRGKDEEQDLSVTLPSKTQRPCEILEGAIFYHYAFHPQRSCVFAHSEPSIDSTNILERYRQKFYE